MRHIWLNEGLVDPYFLMNFAGKEVGVYETYLAKSGNGGPILPHEFCW